MSLALLAVPKTKGASGDAANVGPAGGALAVVAIAGVARAHEIAVAVVPAGERADPAVIRDAEGAAGAVAIVAAGDGAHAARVVLAPRAACFAVVVVAACGADEVASGADGAAVRAATEKDEREEEPSKRSHGQ